MAVLEWAKAREKLNTWARKVRHNFSGRRRINLIILLTVLALVVVGLLNNKFTGEEIGSHTPLDGLPQLQGSQGGPVIYRVSETLFPGDTGDINGSNFNSTVKAVIQPVLNNGSRGASQEMSLRNMSDFLIQADVPGNLTRGLWSVWIEEQVDGSLVASNEVFINQARVTNYLTPTIAANETLEIIGRNLVQNKNDNQSYQNSQAVFVAGSDRLTATVQSGDEYSLKVTAPANLVVGTSYDVYVSNGWGGDGGLNKAEPDYPLAVVAPGVADVFDLKVPWARDYGYAVDPTKEYNLLTDDRLIYHAVADGSTNKTDNHNAIQQAIIYANQHGGGVIYLPTGNYYVDVDSVSSTSIELTDHVVLKGDGIGNTTISYGTLGAVPKSLFMNFGNNDGVNAGFGGLYNLSIVNANANYSGFANPDKYFGIAINKTRGEVFFKNIEYKMGPYDSFSTYDAHQMVIEDSTFTSLYRFKTGTFSFSGDEISQEAVPGNFNIIRNNSFTYLDGRMEMYNLLDSAIENNNIIRDMTGRPNLQDENFCCSGGITANYSNYSIYRNNTIKMINSTPGSREGVNAGESFMNEIHTKFFSQMGTVSSASDSTITDESKNWDTQDRWPNYKNRISFGDPSNCDATTDFNHDGKCADIPSYIQPNGTVVPYAAPWHRRPVVAITNGVGIGQMRHIVGNTANSLALDKPWDMQPTAGSSYKITYFNTEGQLVIDNTIQSGGGVGIMFSDGGFDGIIDGNTLTNAGGIYVFGEDIHGADYQRSCQFLGYRDYNSWQLREIGNPQRNPADNVPIDFDLCYDQHLAWYIQVKNNTVADTNGTYPANIQVGMIQFLNPTDTENGQYISRPLVHGNSLMSIELRNNTVNANPGANLDGNYLATLPINPYKGQGWDYMSKEAIYVMNGGSAMGHVQDVGSNKVTLGTILQDNVVNNLDQGSDIQPYNFSNGVSQTTLRYTDYVPNSVCFNVKLSGLADLKTDNIKLQLIDTSRVNSYKKRDKQLVERIEFLTSDSQGQVSSSDPVADFLLHYKYEIVDLISSGVPWSKHHWVPVDQSTQTYSLWFKAPGFLGRKVADVKASDLLDASKCLTIIADPSAARPGDFNDDNQVSVADLSAAIGSYNGENSNEQVTKAYGKVPGLGNLAAIIRDLNSAPNGDSDSP